MEKLTDEEGIKIAKEINVIYDGIYVDFDFYGFTDRKYTASFVARDLEQAKEKLIALNERFSKRY